MKFTNFKISCECIFPIDNLAHVRWCKTYYHISVNFQNPGFCSVSKPRKPVFIFRPGPTTNGINHFKKYLTCPNVNIMGLLAKYTHPYLNFHIHICILDTLDVLL